MIHLRRRLAHSTAAAQVTPNARVHRARKQRRCPCCLRAQCNDRFGTGPHTQLCSAKKELDLDSVEREDDPPILDAVKNPGV
jgi:hypothetical protein